MHELGVAFEIIKTIEDFAKDKDVKKVTKTVLQIGEVSTIVTSYFEDVWKWATDKSEIMKGSKLVIEPVKAITVCEDCNKTYDTIKFGKECPYCQSPNTHLVQGNEMNIKEIEVE
ncbi:MAG: hydrogenase maturation nickel metallochaperone HypA [Bacilli bacterium]